MAANQVSLSTKKNSKLLKIGQQKSMEEIVWFGEINFDVLVSAVAILESGP